jgi:hypothetical protein
MPAPVVAAAHVLRLSVPVITLAVGTADARAAGYCGRLLGTSRSSRGAGTAVAVAADREQDDFGDAEALEAAGVATGQDVPDGLAVLPGVFDPAAGVAVATNAMLDAELELEGLRVAAEVAAALLGKLAMCEAEALAVGGGVAGSDSDAMGDGDADAGAGSFGDGLAPASFRCVAELAATLGLPLAVPVALALALTLDEALPVLLIPAAPPLELGTLALLELVALETTLAPSPWHDEDGEAVPFTLALALPLALLDALPLALVQLALEELLADAQTDAERDAVLPLLAEGGALLPADGLCEGLPLTAPDDVAGTSLELALGLALELASAEADTEAAGTGVGVNGSPLPASGEGDAAGAAREADAEADAEAEAVVESDVGNGTMGAAADGDDVTAGLAHAVAGGARAATDAEADADADAEAVGGTGESAPNDGDAGGAVLVDDSDAKTVGVAAAVGGLSDAAGASTEGEAEGASVGAGDAQGCGGGSSAKEPSMLPSGAITTTTDASKYVSTQKPSTATRLAGTAPVPPSFVNHICDALMVAPAASDRASVEGSRLTSRAAELPSA